MPSLYFLIGPTACGKTAMAIEWARLNSAEILCADSPLVYKGMDIGTAKPRGGEISEVVHHGIDLVEITERFSVGDYAAYAQKVIQRANERKKMILVVGGSGFYVKSFFKAPTDNLPLNEEVRKKVEGIYVSFGLEGTLKMLKEKGGEDLSGLDIKNPRRVIKALERVMSSHKSYQELREIYERKEPPFERFEKKVLLVSRENEDLHQRIEGRTLKMIEDGLIEEVLYLKSHGLRENPQASCVIGYRETLEYLEGKINKQELIRKIVRNTLLLARKQIRIFKQLPINKIIKLKKNQPVEFDALFCRDI